ncbi:concanavalin A-like lectin/glucanase domain-containing protein [Baffinella frigidus]|nr:concanavalin A-like lectin/glucanase domain-containing protein [Cryptophyta sp. CCMP2293]
MTPLLGLVAALLPLLLLLTLAPPARAAASCRPGLLVEETGYAVLSENTYLGRCGVTLGLGSGPLTIEMSVQIPDDAPPPWFMHSLFSYETYSVSGWDLLLLNTAGKLELIQNGFTATHGYQTPPPFDLSDGAWYHLAVTREVVADVCTYSFYKNGIMVGSPTSDPAYPTCPTIPDGGCVVLGQEQNKDTECGGFKSDYDLVGNMTEVRVWKTSRSPEQILANMDLRITNKEKDLVAAWPLDCRHYYDDILGNADLSGCVPATSWTAEVAHYSLPKFNGEGCPSPECTNECYNGTHNCHAHATCDNTKNSFTCTCDAPHWEGDGVSCVPTKPFKEHGCPTGHAIFSENTYLGRCGVNLGLEDGPFTIEMWVQLPDVVAYPLAFFQQPLFSYETESINGWDLLLFNTVDGKIKPHQDGFGPKSTGNAFDLSDGAWHHLAVTREEVENECTYSFYKDGAIVGTNPDLADPLSACRMIQDGGCVVLGQVQNKDAAWVYPGFRIDGFTQDFVGNITEVRIWRTSRSQQDIQDKMHVRITATEQDLVAAWPLDCLHQYDDILRKASFDGMCFAPSPYSLATFKETCSYHLRHNPS